MSGEEEEECGRVGAAEQKQHNENIAKKPRARGWPAALGRNGVWSVAFVRGSVEIAVKIGML